MAKSQQKHAKTKYNCHIEKSETVDFKTIKMFLELVICSVLNDGRWVAVVGLICHGRI